MSKLLGLKLNWIEYNLKVLLLQDGGFTGLISLMQSYIKSMDVDVDTVCTISQYLNLISKRASGKLCSLVDQDLARFQKCSYFMYPILIIEYAGSYAFFTPVKTCLKAFIRGLLYHLIVTNWVHELHSRF